MTVSHLFHRSPWLALGVASVLAAACSASTSPPTLPQSRVETRPVDAAAQDEAEPEAASVAPDPASAPSAENEADVCAARSPAQTQFDFWLGRWAVRNAEGKLVGHNHIARLPGGCALIETWRSVAGTTGTSLNYVHPDTGKWIQVWVDQRGGLLEMEGSFDGNAMILVGPYMHAGGKSELVRGTWTLLEDGRVRQRFEGSTDGGQTFEDQFDGYYTRLPDTDASDPRGVQTLD